MQRYDIFGGEIDIDDNGAYCLFAEAEADKAAAVALKDADITRVKDILIELLDEIEGSQESDISNELYDKIKAILKEGE